MRSALGITLAAVAVWVAAPETAHAKCQPPASDLVTQTRTARGYQEIDLSAPAHLVLTQGPRESIKVRADRRVLPYLTTRVTGRKLVIDLEDDRRRYRDIECAHETVIEITVPQLSAMSVSGAGSVEMPKWSGKRLDFALSGAGSVEAFRMSLADIDVDISGAGSLIASGQASRQKVSISGAGSYGGERLAGQTAAVSISGSGSARVNAGKSLDVSVSGVGGVTYVGNPRVKQQISGMGSVARLKR